MIEVRPLLIVTISYSAAVIALVIASPSLSFIVLINLVSLLPLYYFPDTIPVN